MFQEPRVSPKFSWKYKYLITKVSNNRTWGQNITGIVLTNEISTVYSFFVDIKLN